jgi:hypothetical protein
VKANFAADYAIQNNIPYMMKCDNDLFFRGSTLDYMIEHLELLNHPSHLTLGPCLSSGIPCVEYFMDDYLNEEQRVTLKSKFLETKFEDIWGGKYTHHNRFTINTPEPKTWDGEGFFRDVRANEHHYKGIHPIRINLDAINYLNEQIIANKDIFYKSTPTGIIRDNTSPYLCNSVYCIKASTYKDILNDQSLFVDCYDEVPLNKYAWRTNAAHLFVKNGYGIHMHYNTIPENLSRERLFCEKFFLDSNRFMSISVLIYTHDEYSFLWKATFPLCKKYIDASIPVHVLYNDNANKDIVDKEIPSDYIHHTYSCSQNWTKRVLKGLNEIESDYILFIHEDWLPIGDVKKEILDEMVGFLKENDGSYLLSYSHFSITDNQEGVPTKHKDYYFFKEIDHIFQPAIWEKSAFVDLCTTFDKPIYENEDPHCRTFMSKKNCYSVQNKPTVHTLRTTNALFFPHMHAICQGQWTFKKYPTLKELLDSYGVDTNKHGINLWWETNTQ